MSADAQYVEMTVRCQVLEAMIRSNCPDSYNKFLDSYFFNLEKCLFKVFPDSHFWNYA